MGDIKSKIKYMICSNDFANSLLKIYFGVKKDGISHLGNVIGEERYNKYYRKPWVVNKKEVIRQKKSLQIQMQIFLLVFHVRKKQMPTYFQVLYHYLGKVLTRCCQ